MDLETYKRLDNLLLTQPSGLTVRQFQELLSQTLGEDAALVQQLNDWASTDYEPSQLFSLDSVLRHKVVEATPSFNSLEETAKLIQDDINGEKLLRDGAFDLFNVQRLHLWVTDYKAAYDQITSTS
jgi:hypothetical protein